MSSVSNLYLFDIDGTLSKDGKIPASAIVALSELRKQGDTVMLATGRCLGQMQDILSQIEIDGAVLNNGALIIAQNRILFSSEIDKNTIAAMLKNHFHLAFLTEKEYLRIEQHPIFDEFVPYFDIEAPKLVDRSYLFTQKIYSMGLYGHGLKPSSFHSYPDLRFVPVCPIGYDVMNGNIHKASGIGTLRRTYPGRKIIAFGDNYNDIELLRAADISVAMALAPDEVKRHSDYVTLDPLEDGIYYALHQILKSI